VAKCTKIELIQVKSSEISYERYLAQIHQQRASDSILRSMFVETLSPAKPLIKALRGRYLTLNSNKALRDIERSQHVTIVCFHSVGKESNPCNPSLSIDLFSKLLLFIKRNYQVITFRDLDDIGSFNKPYLILTFDDGYEDFLNFVVPQLDEKNFKANLNVIPWCIQTGKPPLNVLAQDFVGQAPSELIHKLEIPGYKGANFKGKRLEFGLLISSFLKNLPIEDQLMMYENLESQFLSFDEFKPITMLDSKQIGQISNLIELGAHSYHHASMTSETAGYFKKDLELCKTYFADELNSDVEIYAFPNGYYSESHLDIGLDYGFKHLLLTETNFSNVSSIVHPRLSMYGNTIGELVARMLNRW